MSEKEPERESQSESERARETERELGSGSQVPCSQLIMHDNEREIGSQNI